MYWSCSVFGNDNAEAKSMINPVSGKFDSGNINYDRYFRCVREVE